MLQAFSEEQRAELHAVEAQIKRRLAIGAAVSERKVRLPALLLPFKHCVRQ
jgi:hypothetical protein